jgi:hypothetical protein
MGSGDEIVLMHLIPDDGLCFRISAVQNAAPSFAVKVPAPWQIADLMASTRKADRRGSRHHRGHNPLAMRHRSYLVAASARHRGHNPLAMRHRAPVVAASARHRGHNPPAMRHRAPVVAAAD